jgi:hypothetical protein
MPWYGPITKKNEPAMNALLDVLSDIKAKKKAAQDRLRTAVDYDPHATSPVVEDRYYIRGQIDAFDVVLRGIDQLLSQQSEG